MKRIHVNPALCAGCRQCEMVCSYHHTSRFSPSLARVTVHKDDRYGLDYPVMCHQCSDCTAASVCPTGAINASGTGGRQIDSEKCIACGACVEACKYDAVKLNHSALICDQCNGNPNCVERCPTGALSYKESPESVETPETAFKMLKEMWSLE